MSASKHGRARVFKSAVGWEAILPGGTRARGFQNHMMAMEYAVRSVERFRSYWELVRRADQ